MSNIIVSPNVPIARTYEFTCTSNWLVNASDITVNTCFIDMTSALYWDVNSCNTYFNARDILDSVENLSTSYWKSVPNLSQSYWNTRVQYTDSKNTYYSLADSNDLKLDKAGGTVSGNVSLTGVLSLSKPLIAPTS